MAITDPFTFTHNARSRVVDVQNIVFDTPTGGDLSMVLSATTYVALADDIDAQAAKLQNARFTQAETIAAFQAQLASMGLTMTNAQIGELLTGAAEQAVRIRWEDD